MSNSRPPPSINLSRTSGRFSSSTWRNRECMQWPSLNWFTPAASTRLLASDGSLLANLHGEIDRDPVPLADIPSHLRNAVIAIEDRRFWHHSGIDPRGTIRAFVQNLMPHHRIEGGSTISEQLVKNLYFFGRARTVP